MLLSFDGNVIAFVLLVPGRFLVQSRVWVCAPLHQQITGERGGQSPAVCLQGSGLHPGTRVTQVPLQWGAGQVSRGRITACATKSAWARCGVTSASGCSGCSSAVFSPDTLLFGQFAQVLFDLLLNTLNRPFLTKTSEMCQAQFLEGRP